MNSFFSSIEAAKPDPILGVTEAFRADTSPMKVNLGVGVYQDGNGAIPILACVKEASTKWIASEDTKTYLPIDGVPAFVTATQREIFGADSATLKDKRVATCQAVGGSGALKLGAEFIKNFFPGSVVYLSNPSWENHQVLFSAAGLKTDTYPYYDASTSGLCFDRMCEKLRTLPEKSVVLLHACCHNPTGVDLSQDEWRVVVDICTERALIPFVDMAYQGFAEGLDTDAFAIRLLADRGLTFFVSNSYAKSFSLYRERAGALSIVTGSQQESQRVTTQIKRLVRTLYSSPPSFGAQVVALVLSSPELRDLWVSELDTMRTRILEMRQLFVDSLKTHLPERDFSFILRQRGMFSYSGLSAEVVRHMREHHHVYALESGRICVAAMNVNNMEYICKAIASGTKQ